MRKEPLKVNILFILSTLFLKSRSGGLSNVFYKTTLITGGVGGDKAGSQRTFQSTFLAFVCFHCPQIIVPKLFLKMPICCVAIRNTDVTFDCLFLCFVQYVQAKLTPPPIFLEYFIIY